MKALKYCRTASFVPMMAFLIAFFVYITLDKGFDGILTTTTYMFCGMLLVEWLIQKFSDEDFSLGLVHWLSFALAVALFDELVKKYKEKKGEKTDN